MKTKLPMGLVAIAVLAALLAVPGSLVRAQPVATIALPAPGGTVQLYPWCNNIALSFPDGTASNAVAQAVTPAGSVQAIWRHNAALNTFEGFSPAAPPEANDLLTVDFMDAVWLCVTAAAAPPTATPQQIATPTVVPSPTSLPTVAPTPTPSPTVPPTQEMTLGEAIDAGLVDARVTGVSGPGGGSSSGDSIMLGLTKRVSGEVHIDLPRGTVLAPSHSGFQSMVVRGVKGRTSSQQSATYEPTATIVLTEAGEQWFLVEAYCLDTSLENPNYSTDFSVGGLALPQVVQVLAAADRLQPEPSLVAVQLAVWAANEDPTAAEVTSRFPADQQDFDQARAILVEAGINPDSKRMFQ